MATLVGPAVPTNQLIQATIVSALCATLCALCVKSGVDAVRTVPFNLLTVILRPFDCRFCLSLTTGKQYYADDHFEWDHVTAAGNLRDHKVAFEMAREVFKDISAIDWDDNGQDGSEDRFVTIGSVENRLLLVSYAQRGDRIRIISARLAEPYERRRYHNENPT